MLHRTLHFYSSKVLRLRNDLYCVRWGVKLYSLTHSKVKWDELLHGINLLEPAKGWQEETSSVYDAPFRWEKQMTLSTRIKCRHHKLMYTLAWSINSFKYASASDNRASKLDVLIILCLFQCCSVNNTHTANQTMQSVFANKSNITLFLAHCFQRCWSV